MSGNDPKLVAALDRLTAAFNNLLVEVRQTREEAAQREEDLARAGVRFLTWLGQGLNHAAINGIMSGVPSSSREKKRRKRAA